MFLSVAVCGVLEYPRKEVEESVVGGIRSKSKVVSGPEGVHKKS